jgi:ABC-type uncharacterized transport system substrate-binding protein
MKRLLLAVLAVLFTATAVLAARPGVLVIESYQSQNPWDSSYLEGLRTELGDRVRLATFAMDTKRLPASVHPRQAEKAWQSYLQTKPDLVILGDDNALKYLGSKLLDQKVPVVYLGINGNPDDYVPAGHNLTGILERPLFDFSVRTIEQILQPAPKKVLVLFDSGTTSRASVAEAFKGQSSQLISNTLVDLKLIATWEEWQRTVREAKQQGYDAIVVGLYHTLVDRQGKNVPADQVLAWTSANTPLPPFSFWDFSIGPEATIGGFVLSGREQGKAAATLVQKVLAGTPPAQIPPKAGENGKFAFSHHQLQKWGLQLPEQISTRADWTD